MGNDATERAPSRSGRSRRPGGVGRPAAALGIWLATGALFVISAVVQPQSLSIGSLQGMLPFAAILAVVAAGQTLIIQQGGIDLSVPGMISLGVVMLTRIPNGDESKLPMALGLALIALVGFGLANGIIVNKVGITPIVTTLGMNALLFGLVIFISGGTPRDTTATLQSLITDPVLGVGRGVFVAIITLLILATVVKRTSAGRRFEAVGASRAAARAAGFPSVRFEIAAYVGAGLMYFIGSVLLAGVVKTPSAFQGNNYLLPSVAAVVLGGTSLLGGPGSVIATAGGALFLTQLQQLLRTTDLNAGVVFLVQAAAIAVGVAVHSVRRDALISLFALPARRRGVPP